jgi:hypothetical protein
MALTTFGLGYPTNAWGTFIGKPFVTVSPVGAAGQGAPANGGADYGPDSNGTLTSGIQEAIGSGAASVVLLAKQTLDTSTLQYVQTPFGTSTPIQLPSNRSLALVSAGPQDRTPTGSAVIQYSGTSGYAIDTNTTNGSGNVRGYMDGLVVSTMSSGVHFNQVIYNIGTLEVYGSGAAGSIGVNFDYLSAPYMAHIHFLRVGVFGQNHVRINQDHWTCDHLETAFAYSTETSVVEKDAGWGTHIGYWHHFCSNQAPARHLYINTANSKALFIGVYMQESSSYTNATSYDIDNSVSGAEPLLFGQADLVTGTLTITGPTMRFDTTLNAWTTTL